MPMFDYQCKKCGEVGEYIVKTAGTRNVKCKRCGSKEMTRLIGAPNVAVANPNRREPTNTYPKNPFYN